MGRVGGYLSEELKFWFVEDASDLPLCAHHQIPESHSISIVGIGDMHEERGAIAGGSRAKLRKGPESPAGHGSGQTDSPIL